MFAAVRIIDPPLLHIMHQKCLCAYSPLNRFFTEHRGTRARDGRWKLSLPYPTVGGGRLSLLQVERSAWATQELCELVHRFEPKRAQQGTQDFVPSTNMRVQLKRSPASPSQNGSRVEDPCRVQGVPWERVPSGDFAEGESDEERSCVPGRRRPSFPHFPGRTHKGKIHRQRPRASGLRS